MFEKIADFGCSLFGIEITCLKGEREIRKVFAEIDKKNRVNEIRDLLPILQPGTDIEINLDIPDTKPLTIHYRCDEKRAQEEILRLAEAN